MAKDITNLGKICILYLRHYNRMLVSFQSTLLKIIYAAKVDENLLLLMVISQELFVIKTGL